MTQIPFKKTGLLTTASVREITLMLALYYDYSKNIVVPNVTTGLFGDHEADLVVVSKSGYLTEIEIKRSWPDFLADFKKRSYHKDERIDKLYYAVPECMFEPVRDYLNARAQELPCYERPGIIVYRTMDEPAWKRILVKAEPVSGKLRKKLTDEEIFKLARLGTLRYWSLLARTSDTVKDRKIVELKNMITEIKAAYREATGEPYRLSDAL